MVNDFNFFVDAEITKAKGKGGKYPDELIIQGVASTNDKDSDDEILEPSGFVLDRFLKKGFLNLEHRSKEDMRNIVGEPIEAVIKDNKLVIKGKLYKNNPLAVGIYDTIDMLGKEGSKRKIGFSIEGKALARDGRNPKRITKALITNCAITQSAKNQNTWASIVKGEQVEDYAPNGGQVYLLDVTTDKGHRVVIDKDFNIKVSKAMSTVSAAPLMPESVEKKPKKLKEDFFKNLVTITKGIEQVGLSEKGKKMIKDKLKNILS